MGLRLVILCLCSLLWAAAEKPLLNCLTNLQGLTLAQKTRFLFFKTAKFAGEEKQWADKWRAKLETFGDAANQDAKKNGEESLQIYQMIQEGLAAQLHARQPELGKSLAELFLERKALMSKKSPTHAQESEALTRLETLRDVEWQRIVSQARANRHEDRMLQVKHRRRDTQGEAVKFGTHRRLDDEAFDRQALTLRAKALFTGTGEKLPKDRNEFLRLADTSPVLLEAAEIYYTAGLLGEKLDPTGARLASLYNQTRKDPEIRGRLEKNPFRQFRRTLDYSDRESETGIAQLLDAIIAHPDTLSHHFLGKGEDPDVGGPERQVYRFRSETGKEITLTLNGDFQPDGKYKVNAAEIMDSTFGFYTATAHDGKFVVEKERKTEGVKKGRCIGCHEGIKVQKDSYELTRIPQAYLL